MDVKHKKNSQLSKTIYDIFIIHSLFRIIKITVNIYVIENNTCNIYTIIDLIIIIDGILYSL